MVDVKTIIDRTIVDVLLDMPYYGHVLCQLTKIYTDAVGTIGVGKKRDGLLLNLYISPKYMEGVFQRAPSAMAAYAHLKEVMKHECLHLIFNHIFLDLPDKMREKVACELSVNSYIDRKNLIGQCIFPEDYKLPPKLGVMDYYKRLPQTKTYIVFIGGGKKKGQDGDGEGAQSLDSHEGWKECDVEDALLKDVLRKAKEACDALDSWGNMPSELREAIGAATGFEEQKVDWQTVLRDFLASASETNLDYTNRRPSRRYGTRPGTRKEEVLSLAIGIDTSGSISDEALRMFFDELYWIHRRGAKITVFECDCEIGREYDFGDLDLSGITGGGGTDLEPVVREATERGYDALIYFTDGYAPKIETDYNIPTILVLPEDSVQRRKDLPLDADFVFHVRETGEVDVM